MEAYYEIVDKVIYSACWQNRKEYLLMHCVHINEGKTPEQPTDRDEYFMETEDKFKKDNRN